MGFQNRKTNKVFKAWTRQSKNQTVGSLVPKVFVARTRCHMMLWRMDCGKWKSQDFLPQADFQHQEASGLQGLLDQTALFSPATACCWVCFEIVVKRFQSAQQCPWTCRRELTTTKMWAVSFPSMRNWPPAPLDRSSHANIYTALNKYYGFFLWVKKLESSLSQGFP